MSPPDEMKVGAAACTHVPTTYVAFFRATSPQIQSASSPRDAQVPCSSRLSHRFRRPAEGAPSTFTSCLGRPMLSFRARPSTQRCCQCALRVGKPRCFPSFFGPSSSTEAITVRRQSSSSTSAMTLLAKSPSRKNEQPPPTMHENASPGDCHGKSLATADMFGGRISSSFHAYDTKMARLDWPR